MWNYNNVIIILSGYKPLYIKVWTASKTTNIKSHISATPITCLPFPFLFLAPIDSTCSLLNFAILAFNKLRWASMALLFESRLFSCSISTIH